MTQPSPARRKWQRSSSSRLTTLALFSMLGCTAAAEPAPPERDAAVDGKLKAVAEAHAALTAELAAAPHADLLHCQTTAGDCLISVTERRDELVGAYYLNGCRDPDPEKQGPCIARELEQRGKLAELASFYGTENWCSRKLLECTVALASDLARTAARQRIRVRLAEVEAAPASVAATRAPQFAEERLAFVLSTLPPKAQAACAADSPAHCPNPTNVPAAELDAELAKDPQSYDARRALSLYAAVQQAEADCYAPAFKCSIGSFAQYGATAESERLLQQNLSLLTQQQQIRTRLDPDAAGRCVSDAVIQLRDRVVNAYQAYVRDFAASHLVQLQKAFVALHEAQLRCLSHLKKQSQL